MKVNQQNLRKEFLGIQAMTKMQFEKPSIVEAGAGGTQKVKNDNFHIVD